MAVRNPNHLEHLQRVLVKTDTRKIDIVALSVHVSPPGTEAAQLGADQVFGDAEKELFSRVVAVAEKAGKHVELLVVPGADPWLAIMQTAQRLQSSRVVAGLSPRYNPSELGKVVGEAWEKLPPPRPSLSLEVVLGDEGSIFFNLGPHPPRLWPEDVELLHQIWLKLSQSYFGSKVHHRDVVGVALRRLAKEIDEPASLGAVLNDISAEVEMPRNPEMQHR